MEACDIPAIKRILQSLGGEAERKELVLATTWSIYYHYMCESKDVIQCLLPYFDLGDIPATTAIRWQDWGLITDSDTLHLNSYELTCQR